MRDVMKYYLMKDGKPSQVSWTRYYYEYRFSCREVKRGNNVYLYTE